MEKNEKNSIVNAYFSAAEAMVVLEENETSGFYRKVIPFPPKASEERENNPRSDETRSENTNQQKNVSVRSTRTGQETHSYPAEDVGATCLTIAESACSAQMSLVNWVHVEKHQWMLDVLADLEVYASENALPKTAEALVTARCELISLSARTR